MQNSRFPATKHSKCSVGLLIRSKIAIDQDISLTTCNTHILALRVQTVAKRREIFHVYCIYYSGFMCHTTVIFGITKDGSLVLNPLASWNSFTCRNLFQNGANNMSEWLTCVTAFCNKGSKLCIVRIIRFWSNFASLW